MSGLQTVRALLGKMGSEERTVLRNYLTSFDSRGERFNSKSVKLLDMLGDQPGRPSDSEVEFFIYGKRSTMAFSRLLIRFRDKLLESLLLDVNIRRENSYNEYERNLFEVRKKLSYAQILAERGLSELAYFMYDSVCEIAEYYEFYDEWQQAIRLRMEITGTSQGEEIFERWRQKHEKVERAAKACFDAYCRYTIWMNRFELRQSIPVQDPQLIKDIHLIKNAAEKTSSDQIHFYWLQLDALFLQQQRNYRQARRSLEKLRALVENSRVLFTNHRLGHVLLKLSENELHLHRFNRSIEYSQKAHALMQPGTRSEFQCLDAEFYGHFYNTRFGASRMILQDLLNRDTGRSGLHRRSRRHYILACILFLQGLYREANDLLLELNIIDADHEGWNVALRILLIMTDIERSLHDIAGKRIESARKHLRKLEAMEKGRPRDQIIYESLKLLDQYSYDFKAAYQHLAQQFVLLRSNHPDYRWEVKTPELIIFHEWFFARVIKGEYVHKIPRYAEPDATIVPDHSDAIPE